MIPNPMKTMATIGVTSMQEGDEDYMFRIALNVAMRNEFQVMPDVCTDGGNDKHFFSFTFRGKTLFAAENEIGGLTIMLPEEY